MNPPLAKAKQRVKSKLKQLTKRIRGRSIQSILNKIEQQMTGWINY
ncbi:group II intron maturase-specific domain-containing protein [Enterococcus faecium]